MHRPRDGASLSRTGDLLFLARAWSHRTAGSRYLSVFRRGDEIIHAYEERGGALRHAMTGEALVPGDSSADLTRVIAFKISTFRGILEKRLREFWSLRALLRRFLDSEHVDGARIGERLRVESMELQYPEQNLDAASRIVAGLRCPVQCAGDPLFDHPADLAFTFTDIDVPHSLESPRPICPLDGPVIPIEAEHISPDWTWRASCGRRTGLQICPGCLGRFSAKLLMMS